MNNQEHLRPKNQLQKLCFREFRKWFPELAKRIELVEPKMNEQNFRFSIQSDCPEFGKIEIEIDHTEITVSTDFHHQHFETYLFDDKDDNIRYLKAIYEAFENVKDLINGEVFFELKRKGNQTTNSFKYYKQDPENVASAIVYFKSDEETTEIEPDLPTERIFVDWNGVIKREILTDSNTKTKVNSENPKNSKTKSKTPFWPKLKWW